MTVKYDNTDRWRHLKHFVDTHDYDPSNLEYLKSWIERFTVPPIESNRYEKVSDNSNQYDSISGVPEVTESDTSSTEKEKWKSFWEHMDKAFAEGRIEWSGGSDWFILVGVRQ